MIQAEVITPWIFGGTEENPNRPQLADDHLITKWEDVTGQSAINFPLAKNTYILLVECEDAVIDEIEGNNDYFILWSETIEQEMI